TRDWRGSPELLDHEVSDATRRRNRTNFMINGFRTVGYDERRPRHVMPRRVEGGIRHDGCPHACRTPDHHFNRGIPTLRDHESAIARTTTKRRRFDDDEPTFHKRYARDEPNAAELERYEGELETGDRWSTWDQSSPLQRGPKPYPEWLI